MTGVTGSSPTLFAFLGMTKTSVLLARCQPRSAAVTAPWTWTLPAWGAAASDDGFAIRASVSGHHGPEAASHIRRVAPNPQILSEVWPSLSPFSTHEMSQGCCGHPHRKRQRVSAL